MRYSKYGNRKTECHQGHRHDSKKEAHYCDELEIRKKAKDIIDYEVEPKQVLQKSFRGFDGKMVRAITYTPDFVVYHDGATEFIDIKGSKKTDTPTFKQKWKMLQYKYRDDKNYTFTLIY